MDFITFTVCGVVRDVPSSLMSSYAQVWIPYSSNEALTRVNGEYGENMAGYFSGPYWLVPLPTSMPYARS